MDWMTDILSARRRGNRILFRRDNVLLCGLADSLRQQTHRVVVLWALELAGEAVRALREEYPGEERPALALETARLWAQGCVKMPLAQRRILDCHTAAKALSPAPAALCHAVGQACGTVHTAGHALGFPMYELTALVLTLGPDHCRETVEVRTADYLQRLEHWSHTLGDGDGGYTWAPFLRR